MVINDRATASARVTRFRTLWVLVAMIVLGGCVSTQRTQQLYPVMESDGVVATGYAVIASQRGDTPAQQRLMAIKAIKLDAYRALTGEGLWAICGITTGTMADMAIAEDHLKSRVEGVIYGAQVVSITPIGGETTKPNSLCLNAR